MLGKNYDLPVTLEKGEKLLKHHEDVGIAFIGTKRIKRKGIPGKIYLTNQRVVLARRTGLMREGPPKVSGVLPLSWIISVELIEDWPGFNIEYREGGTTREVNVTPPSDGEAIDWVNSIRSAIQSP